MRQRVRGQSLAWIAMLFAVMIPLIFGLLEWYQRTNALQTAEYIATSIARAGVQAVDDRTLLRNDDRKIVFVPFASEVIQGASEAYFGDPDLAMTRYWTAEERQRIQNSIAWCADNACNQGVWQARCSADPAIPVYTDHYPVVCVMLRIPVRGFGFWPATEVPVVGVARFTW